jgi:predicted Zn-dependent peptidase
VAGAIDWQHLRAAVGRLLGDWEPQPASEVNEGPAGPARDHILRETQQIQIALAYPSETVDSPDYYRARAAAAVLGGYSSARLFTEVREKRALCYSVYTSYESQRDRAAVLCYAGTSADRAQKTLDVTLAEIDRLARSGVEAGELETMRAGLKSSLIMQQESSMSRSGSLASDWFYLGRVRSLDEISAALDVLTPEVVSDYAAGLDLSGMTILTLGPNALRLPP